MITLLVTRIDKSYDFTGTSEETVQNYIVLQLPSGREIRAPINSDDMQSLVDQYETQFRHGESAPSTPREAPAGDAPLTEEEALETPIAWNELDDSVLSPVMKAAFFKLRAPMLMTPRAIMALVEDVSSKFSPEDWREVTGQDVVVESPAPVHAPAPATQQAPVRGPRWADGAPMMPGTVSGRTVPKDEMGYPIVEGEVDAGEVVGHGTDVDEDGVGQL